VPPTTVPRRRLLAAVAGVGAAAAAGTLTGCAGRVDRTGPAGLPVARVVGPDDLATARAVAGRAAALAGDVRAAQRRVARRERSLAPLLAQVAARHDEHAVAFVPEGERVRAPAPAGPGRADRDGSVVATLRGLVRAEERAAAAVRTAALSAGSGDLARALASCAASLSQHVLLLDEAADAAAADAAAADAAAAGGRAGTGRRR